MVAICLKKVYYSNKMTLKNEYQEVLQELDKINSFPRSQIIREVTKNNVTPDIKDAIANIRTIPGVGEKTALEILFKIGINLE